MVTYDDTAEATTRAMANTCPRVRLVPGATPYPESVEGALCHTLSDNPSNNWVILDNGCFVILYEAKADIMGISKEEREQRVRETKLAVARAVVANFRSNPRSPAAPPQSAQGAWPPERSSN